MPGASQNLPKLLDALSPYDIRWVMVGGMAVIVHGGDQLTKDVDMAISFDVENRARLVAALAPLNPRPLRLAPGAAWDGTKGAFGRLGRSSTRTPDGSTLSSG